MPGRSFTTQMQYRYGFNGKEKDLETAETTTYDYGFRIYNPGLGRFLSEDPLAISFPWNSTHSYAEGDVVRSIDLDGMEKYIVHNSSIITIGHIDIIKNEPNGFRHMYLNPNQKEWENGLIGYYDSEGCYTLLQDDSRISDIDKSLLTYNLLNKDEKISGFSIKLTKTSDIYLKTIKQAREGNNTKPPKKEGKKEDDNKTRKKDDKIKKLDYEFSGYVPFVFYSGEFDKDADGFLDITHERNGSITKNSKTEDSKLKNAFKKQGINLFTRSDLEELALKVKNDGSIKNVSVKISYTLSPNLISFNQSNEAGLANYTKDWKSIFSTKSGMSNSKIKINFKITYSNVENSNTTIKLIR